MPLVAIRGLRVYFKIRQGWVRAVDGVDLSIDRGETVGLVGESGCGKTTLAYAITQLLPSNAHIFGGQVIFEPDGNLFPYRQEYWKVAEERMAREIEALQTRIAQTPIPTSPKEDGRHEMEEQLELLRHPLSQTYLRYLEAEIRELGAKVAQLEQQEEAGSTRASQRQLAQARSRLAAARQEGDLLAITRRKDGSLREYHPKLSAVRWAQISIVFQGAMNALNPVYTVGDQIIEAIQIHQDMTRDEARARVEELYRLVGIPPDRICVMYAGEIVEEAPSKKVFAQALHPYTEGLLGAFPSVKGEKKRIDAIPGSPPSLVTPPSGCRFHPRCKYAKDICTTTPPPYIVPEAGHRSLCHFSQDFFAQGGLMRT